MGGKTHHRIYADRVGAAKVHLEFAQGELKKAKLEVDRATCRLWSERMEGFGGPAQPSPTIGQAVASGYQFLKIKCRRCDTFGAIDLGLIYRTAGTEIWKLESSLGCSACRKAHRWKSRPHLIKLMEVNEVELEKHRQWYPPER